MLPLDGFRLGLEKLGGVIVEPMIEADWMCFSFRFHELRWSKPVRLRFCVDDVGFLTMPYYFKLGTIRKTQVAMRASERKADLLLTNSGFTRREFCRYYKTDESRIDVTYLGYDERLFNPRPVQDA